jgi:hypothetical protein
MKYNQWAQQLLASLAWNSVKKKTQDKNQFSNFFKPAEFTFTKLIASFRKLESSTLSIF